MIIDPIRELKVRAERLHRAVTAAEPLALVRLRALNELKKADDAALAAWADEAKRKHCLAVVAIEAGFRSWEHALRAIDGPVPRERAEDGAVVVDAGDLLYPRHGARYMNHWYATYEDARTHREAHGGTLLAYRRHCFVAPEREFIELSLGVDPDDDDWRAIGWDWVCPKNVEARRRLYGRILTSERRFGAIAA